MLMMSQSRITVMAMVVELCGLSFTFQTPYPLLNRVRRRSFVSFFEKIVANVSKAL